VRKKIIQRQCVHSKEKTLIPQPMGSSRDLQTSDPHCRPWPFPRLSPDLKVSLRSTIMPPPSPTKDRSSSPKKTKKKRPWTPNFPHQADHNDHFETPLMAYQDTAPLLNFLAKEKSRKEHIIYDPYCCNGQTSVLFQQLGFETTIHRKRDFCQHIADKTLPTFDTLVTNPPY